MTIPDLGSDLVSVAIRTAIVYIVLVIFFRVVGKREAGQLSTLDLVVLLVISNAVQNAMVGENVTLIGGLLAAAVILVLDWGLHQLNDRFPRLREVVEGEPVLVVRDGQILERQPLERGAERPGARASRSARTACSRSPRRGSSISRRTARSA